MGKPNYGRCKECNRENNYSKWCHACNAKHFRANFENWTSGNDNIDKFIQDAQTSANYNRQILEWIPYDRFINIEYIAEGGFSKVYKAKWIDGYIFNWHNSNKCWNRYEKNKFVALKSLNNSSESITLKFINEIKSHYKVNNLYITKFYGITQDPETKDYMMVLDYADNGSLRKYLDTNKSWSWKEKIYFLHEIACGLNTIHKKELIHQDLHAGNILISRNGSPLITDMGLCKPADSYDTPKNTKNEIYSVLPYTAPEVLKRKRYTKAADIYSFGMIMYEVSSGLPPYHDMSHDITLATMICQGLRPRFNIRVPQLIVNLIKECLDANPFKRPTAFELQQTLLEWSKPEESTELQRQIEEADKINNSLAASSLPLPNLSYETHSEAVYTSRLLNFNNLPNPKNSDDYYEQNNNMISTEFLESLEASISQLKISNDDKSSELNNKEGFADKE